MAGQPSEWLVEHERFIRDTQALNWAFRRGGVHAELTRLRRELDEHTDGDTADETVASEDA